MTQQLPKTVLFDMDGVLIDSMPMHVDAWINVYKQYDMNPSEEYLYGEEGRVGTAAIAKLFKEEKGITLSPKEQREIYAIKAADVKSRNSPPPVEDMLDFVKLVKKTGTVSVVTGSGQPSLMDMLDTYYPACFEASNMVAAKDVKYGKPHPEPYLMGLEKHKVQAHEAIVIENAPLGVLSAKAAGCFVMAINIGKLSNQVLADAGADVVFNSAQEMTAWWKDTFLSE